MMVNDVGIYGFCLFKQKRWVRANVSINTNMYGLKRAAGYGEKKYQKKKATIPLYLLLPHVVGKFEQLNLNMQPQSVRLCGC